MVKETKMDMDAEVLYESMVTFYEGLEEKVVSSQHREQHELRLEGFKTALWVAAKRLGRDESRWA